MAYREPMKFVELDAGGWRSPADFAGALKQAIGAPDWHGSGIDAFLDTMIYHDDINALKAPYTIVIRGLSKAGIEVQTMARILAEHIEHDATSDWGTDLEVRMKIEEAD
jgi:hypothetical protein